MFFKKKSKSMPTPSYRMADIDPYLLADMGYEPGPSPKARIPQAWYFNHYR